MMLLLVVNQQPAVSQLKEFEVFSVLRSAELQKLENMCQMSHFMAILDPNKKLKLNHLFVATNMHKTNHRDIEEWMVIDLDQVLEVVKMW